MAKEEKTTVAMEDIETVCIGTTIERTRIRKIKRQCPSQTVIKAHFSALYMCVT
jgi:hypothetical protein